GERGLRGVESGATPPSVHEDLLGHVLRVRDRAERAQGDGVDEGRPACVRLAQRVLVPGGEREAEPLVVQLAVVRGERGSVIGPYGHRHLPRAFTSTWIEY